MQRERDAQEAMERAKNRMREAENRLSEANAKLDAAHRAAERSQRDFDNSLNLRRTEAIEAMARRRR